MDTRVAREVQYGQILANGKIGLEPPIILDLVTIVQLEFKSHEVTLHFQPVIQTGLQTGHVVDIEIEEVMVVDEAVRADPRTRDSCPVVWHGHVGQCPIGEITAQLLWDDEGILDA